MCRDCMCWVRVMDYIVRYYTMYAADRETVRTAVMVKLQSQAEMT